MPVDCPETPRARPAADVESDLDAIEVEHDEVLRRREQLDDAEARLLGRVRDAKRHGASWEQIGNAMGVARQSAWQKYHDEIA